MKSRDIVFNKFHGNCAYCGCGLGKGWHIDHLKPVIRSREYRRDIGGKKHYRVTTKHPERDCIENKMPACASCNINKRDQSIEQFRMMIKKFIQSLNNNSVQYKIAKRYGLIVESDIDVIFYFEKL